MATLLQSKSRKVCSYIFGSLALLPFGSNVSAVEPPLTFDNSKLAAFIDPWINDALADHSMPGAVCVVVHKGAVRFIRGYGLADQEREFPMSPQQTLLRVGSISKLITTTAIMQAWEAGHVDLHTDIRRYVDEAILKDYSYPITLHDLLTHSAGVGERFFRQTVDRHHTFAPLLLRPSVDSTLATYLLEILPRPVSREKNPIRYSNFGITLAAHVVESAMHLRFADFARDSVLRPLGMSRSTFLPEAMDKDALASGYKYIFGHYRLLSPRHWKCYPASSFVTTGEDIARFMVAHLEKGLPQRDSGEQVALFSTSTAEEMHSRQKAILSDFPGMAYGFWEAKRNGLTILWHSGHMPGHRTGLFLIPEHQLGVFIYNNSDKIISHSFLKDFLNYLFPNTQSDKKDDGWHLSNDGASKKNLQDFAAFEGFYRYNWYPQHQLGKLTLLILNEPIKVRAFDDATLLVNDVVYKQDGDKVFKNKAGNLIGFVTNASGDVTHLYKGGISLYEKMSRFQTKTWQLTFLATTLFFFCFFFIFFLKKCPGNALYLRIPKTITAVMRVSSICLSGIYLLFLLGFFIFTARGAYSLVQDPPTLFYLLMLLPVLSLVLNSLIGLMLFLKWKQAVWDDWERWAYLGLLLVSIMFIVQLNQWNMLGFYF